MPDVLLWDEIPEEERQPSGEPWMDICFVDDENRLHRSREQSLGGRARLLLQVAPLPQTSGEGIRVLLQSPLVVGFDTATPTLISDFAAGKI